MKLRLSTWFAVVSTLALPSGLMAAGLGDPGAPLLIAEWVKGGPVDLTASKGKKIVVVEFWATWCPPCRTSIPHLTQLQKKFKDKDVVIVGVTDEKPGTVKPFVEKQGDQMDYAVAIDQDRQTAKGYMEAYGIGGIPHAFVVDKTGQVVWEGHPMSGLDETLEQLVAGKYDLEVARKRSAATAKLGEFFEAASDDTQNARADALEKELIALDRELGGLMNGQPFDPAALRKQARFNGAMQALQEAMFSGADEATVTAAEQKARGVTPPGFNLDEFLVSLRTQAAFQQYMQAAVANDTAKAAPLAAKLSQTDCRDPQLLNQIAWMLLTEESLKHRDLALATQIAKVANDVTQGKDSNILDTYARALFDSGKVAEAVELQKKAVGLCSDAENLKSMKATLAEYEKKATR